MLNSEIDRTESHPNATDDVAELRSVVAQKEQHIQAQEKQLTDQQHLIAEQQHLILLLQERLRLARQKRLGASSEKLPLQIDFFDEAELEMALCDIDAQLPPEQAPTPAKPRAPREGFSDKLPRVRVYRNPLDHTVLTTPKNLQSISIAPE